MRVIGFLALAAFAVNGCKHPAESSSAVKEEIAEKSGSEAVVPSEEATLSVLEVNPDAANVYLSEPGF